MNCQGLFGDVHFWHVILKNTQRCDIIQTNTKYCIFGDGLSWAEFQENIAKAAYII